MAAWERNALVTGLNEEFGDGPSQEELQQKERLLSKEDVPAWMGDLPQGA